MVAEQIARNEVKALKVGLVSHFIGDTVGFKYKGKRTEYFTRQEFKKEKIVLHHTVGNLYGDMLALTSQKNISTAYLVGRMGQVIELFDPKYWAYHLGKTALGGNSIQSRKSIGIEISNYGFLVEKEGILYNVYNQAFCKVTDTDLFTKLEKPYRGYVYWCNYTEAQYVAVAKLLKHLCKEFEIPFVFLPEDKRTEFTTDVIDFKGIVTHVNFRQFDKWDVSPIFNFNKLIEYGV